MGVLINHHLSLYLSFFLLFLNLSSSSVLLVPPNNAFHQLIAAPPIPPPPPPAPAPPLPFSNLQGRSNTAAPFKPSIAAIVGVLTTFFSITFLLLLYAKHCKTGSDGYYSSGGANANSRGLLTPSAARRNSGIDRTVIESLPVFRFGSLRGHKDGLECAVCLNRFEPTELLRLLPKCKHAFHVECVDTWLDAHSTCPLCRYRVDPEDILLIDNLTPPPQAAAPSHRVSGRHSSAGERGTGLLQIVLEKPTEPGTRRSLDSSRKKKNTEAVPVLVGCFDKHRKDGLLLAERSASERRSFENRFGHRIVVSAGGPSGGRWSEVRPSDLLYLRSEMIMSEGRSSRASGLRPDIDGGGRSVINGRCVSEITGLNRTAGNFNSTNQQLQEQQQLRHAGLVSRWTAWISQSRPTVRSGQATTAIVAA